ncbi:unnamed protein product [Nezara viridula]|uniref:Uncharacterized protein n=1 Tax=Nezara viridula TaxID=85310 RepID=A0A9P0EH75_NEZVI|nr:unnamed protein product [Nezara viridula]
MPDCRNKERIAVVYSGWSISSEAGLETAEPHSFHQRHISSSLSHKKMNKLVLISFLAACLVALAQAEDNRPRLTVEASRREQGGERHDTYRISQDAWRSKDGRFSAGGYVEHNRDRYPGGYKTRDTHGGLEVRGTF